MPTTNPVVEEGISRYLHQGDDLPWISFVKPLLVDDAISIRGGVSIQLVLNLRADTRIGDAGLCFMLLNPGERPLSILKKLFFIRSTGFSGEIHGWIAKSNNAFFRRAQFRNALFEHHAIAALRSLSSSPYGTAEDLEKIDPTIDITSEARTWTQAIWESKGWKGRLVVALAPGAMHGHKRWPSEKFTILCQIIQEEFNAVFIIVGTRVDAEIADLFLTPALAEVQIFAGATTLMESAALLAKCDVLIGNDGGAMHLGAAVGCASISIIPGLEYPGAIDPWGNEMWSVRHSVPCSPCYSFTRCPEG